MASSVLAELDQLEQQARSELAGLSKADELQALRVEFLGRKGRLTNILRQLGQVASEEKPTLGKRANEVKQFLEAEFDRVFQQFGSQQVAQQLQTGLDVTLPGRRLAAVGHAHPITTMARCIAQIFGELGFSIYEGPELETDYYNFEALNVPPDHPARDMQDTFYVRHANDSYLLRTHTSPVQIRVMEQHPPPIRMIAPGAVFRRDADVTHSPMFHQVEGLYVDVGVTMQHLKGVLLEFLDRLLGQKVCVRFRPSYFPFTEPSAEVDIGYVRGNGSLRLAHADANDVTDWMEVMGCGMVDPAVFKAVGYDARTVTGFAFGMGVERLAMLQWGIDDIRLLFESDVRFLKQF